MANSVSKYGIQEYNDQYFVISKDTGDVEFSTFFLDEAENMVEILDEQATE